MSFSLIQITSASGASGSPHCSFSTASTAGNMIIASIGVASSGTIASVPSGYTLATENTNFSVGISIIYQINAPSTTTLTTVIPSNSNAWTMIMAEWSGIGAFDQKSDGSSGLAGIESMGLITALQTGGGCGTVVTTVPVELLIGVLSATTINSANTPLDPSYTKDLNAGGPYLENVHKVVGTTGSYGCTDGYYEGGSLVTFTASAAGTIISHGAALLPCM